MIQKQNQFTEIVPPFFLRSLLSLDASVSTTMQKEKDAKKKMNPSNARALTAMKQKLKKVLKEYESDLRRYQEVRSHRRSVA